MEITAKKRQVKGSKINSYRKQGLIPGVIFSKLTSRGEKPTTEVFLDSMEFKKLYKDAGESTLITLKVDSDPERKVLINEVQFDPITLEPIHVSFYRVDLTQKINAPIPVEIINEEACFPVTSGAGILLTVLDEIEVECLPTDLPSAFEVDVSVLKEVGDVLTVADAIKVDPQKVEIKNNPEEIVIKVDYAEQLEVEEEESSVEDVAVESEEKAAERAKEKDSEEEKSNQGEKSEEKAE